MIFLEVEPGIISRLEFQPGGELLAAGTNDGRIVIWDQAFQPKVLPQANPINDLIFTTDGQTIATVDNQGHFYLLDLLIMQQISPIRKASLPIAAVRVINNRSFILAYTQRTPDVSTNSTIVIHQLDYNRRQTPTVINVGIKAMDFHPGKKLLACSTERRQLHLQDISRSAFKPVMFKNEARAVAISPDGRWLAVADDWQIMLFLTEPWPSRPVTFGRHRGIVSALKFTADSRYLISGSWDQTVRLWDVDSQSERANFNWEIGRIYSVAVSDDGFRAAAGGDRGKAIIWDLDG